jgi:rubrerythrin
MGTNSDRRTRGRAVSEDEGAVQDAEVRVDRPAKASSETVEAPLDDPGFADFAAAGTGVAGEFRCANCGYGAVVRRELPSCPMCGGTVWESRPPRSTE